MCAVYSYASPAGSSAPSFKPFGLIKPLSHQHCMVQNREIWLDLQKKKKKEEENARTPLFYFICLSLVDDSSSSSSYQQQEQEQSIRNLKLIRSLVFPPFFSTFLSFLRLPPLYF